MATIGTPTGGAHTAAAAASGDRIPIMDVSDSGNNKNKYLTVTEAMKLFGQQSLIIPCTDDQIAATAGTAKVTFRMPYAFTVTAVRASLTVAQTSGSILTVDINEGGVSILSTKLTIDNTELTSTTAVTPPVLSDTSLADDAEITIDVDQIGDGTAKGLKVCLIGYIAVP